jgi:hypothetical protein
MDWQARYYPLDVFPGFGVRIEALIGSSECAAVQLVLEELNAIAPPGLKTWAGAHPGLFVPLDPEVQVEAQAIEARYPDLTDPKAPYQSADAYVIALARVHNGIVISQETAAHEKRNPKQEYYIPDVCRDLGVSCINLLGLMRREKWTF